MPLLALQQNNLLASASSGTAWSETVWAAGVWDSGVWNCTGTLADPAAVISGSLVGAALEAEVQRTYQDLVITLARDTFVSPLTGAIKNAILAGITSAGSETYGWNNEVRDKAKPINVTRVADTIVRIDFAPSTAYSISSNETVTVTVPATALTAASALTATPTFTVTAATASGTAIQNTTATTDVPQNYEICQRTGFRVRPGELDKDGYGELVRKESRESRHPQDVIRGKSASGGGPKSPEGSDTFLSTNEVTADDL